MTAPRLVRTAPDQPHGPAPRILGIVLLLATVPLVVGVLWMLLVMELIGLKLNFYNLVVLPAVLGIGNDAGVHLVHRYREEGVGSVRRVLRYTGEHVAMGSVTTMIGFGRLSNQR